MPNPTKSQSLDNRLEANRTGLIHLFCCDMKLKNKEQVVKIEKYNHKNNKK